MKRCGIILIAMMVAAGAMAATNVTSVNAVGFIRTTVPDDGWALISLPFEQLDGEATVTVPDVLPDAPDGTRAWYYRDGAWKAETKKQFIGWDPGTNEFIRGDGLFVNVPSGGGDVTLTIMGEVPSEQTAPDSTLVVNMGWTIFGLAYPVDMPFTNTTLAADAEVGDRIWWWDSDTDGWAASTKKQFIGWDPADVVLDAGRGYFYNSATQIAWTEDKPYVWP